MNKIFENSADAELFDLFLKQEDSGDKLNLNITKSKIPLQNSALGKFQQIFNDRENENLLFIDFNSNSEKKSKFLDKFYLIEIEESRGIILHEKLNFEILEEAGIRKI